MSVRVPLLLAAVATVLLLAPAARAQQAVKLGVFDPNKILTSSKQGQAIQDEVNKFRMEREAEVKRKKDEFDKLSDQYKASAPTTSVERKEQMENDLVERRRELERLLRDADADIQRRLKKGLSQLEGEIAKVLDTYAKSNGYTLIFSRDQVAYALPAIDVSDDLIKLLDVQPPAKTASSTRP
jgi:Skp family chaperone for outer membrane proteins